MSFDLSLARGLDYYTGVIYEAVLTGMDFYAAIIILYLFCCWKGTSDTQLKTPKTGPSVCLSVCLSVSLSNLYISYI